MFRLYLHNSPGDLKAQKYQLTTYVAFIDFVNAFETVSKGKLSAIMAKKGIRQHLMRAIQCGKQNLN